MEACSWDDWMQDGARRGASGEYGMTGCVHIMPAEPPAFPGGEVQGRREDWRHRLESPQ